MQVIDDLTHVSLNHDTVLTIGAFDGVHRGHQYLIRQVVQSAQHSGRLAGVVTFHPHPNRILHPDNPTPYLTTPGEKIALLEHLHLDLVAFLPFDWEMARTGARDFIASLHERLHMQELWVGADFQWGHNREGDRVLMEALARELGFTVHFVPPLTHGGKVISSTRIRRLLREGKVREAGELLGRYPSLSGEVVPGARRGHRIGFPTANLEVRAERAVPANGIYAVFALLGEERYQGVTNIGVRPTFDNGERIVETHILDFEGDIYGCDLVVEFVERLRPEVRFPSVDELVAQIRRDIAIAREILAREEPHHPMLKPTPCKKPQRTQRARSPSL